MKSKFFLWLALPLMSCATTTSGLRTRFAREHACAEAQVQVRERGGNIYVAEGCGQHAEYVCGGFLGASGTERSRCAERGIAAHDRSSPKPLVPAEQEPPR